MSDPAIKIGLAAAAGCPGFMLQANDLDDLDLPELLAGPRQTHMQ